MTFSPRRTIIAVLATAVALTASCRTADDLVAPAQLGSRGGPEDAPAVSSVAPDIAARGATLNITVTGVGFDSGSVVALERQGEPAGGIRTNSTSYLTPTTLIASISIPADADTGKYDVAVFTSHRRKGVGIELFEVLYELVEVGVIGGTWSLAAAINDLGQVVGTSCTEDCLGHGFFWSESGGLEDLGTLPGFSRSEAYSINNRGQVLGSVLCHPNDPGCNGSPAEVVLWEKTGGFWTATPLGIPRGGPEGDLNNAGQLVKNGRLYSLAGSTAESSEFSPMIFQVPGRDWRWYASPVLEERLPGLPSGQARMFASAINDLGIVAGRAWVSDTTADPVIWFRDQSGAWRILPLGHPPGFNLSVPQGISEADAVGQIRIVGNSTRPRSSASQPVVWIIGSDGLGGWRVIAMESLEIPREAALTLGARAWGVNAQGAVVGEYTWRGEGGYGYLEAVTWLPDGTAETLLPAPAPGGMARAKAINNHGRIVGSVWDEVHACERAAFWRPPTPAS